MTIAHNGPSASFDHKVRRPAHFHGAGALVPQIVNREYVHPRCGVSTVAGMGEGKVFPGAGADAILCTGDLLTAIGIQEGLDVPAEILGRG